ncbi:hypothetical protein JB92DRAFT_2835208 [Gautieria morchelliformis]|nr:hypothetical protein JB92DRAFT_2835208 [Gautieria morchelliformis]
MSLRNSLSGTSLSITPPSYPASPSPTIADSPDENITWDGKTLNLAPPPMRSQLVAGNVIFNSNLVLEHMSPEVAGITTQWTADAWSCAQEICNTSMIIPANEYVRQYKWAQCTCAKDWPPNHPFISA